VDREIEIINGISLLPTESLPDSFTKRRILEAAKKLWKGALYHSTVILMYLALPLLRELPIFPILAAH
jgi:hypothetical protein